MEHLLRCHPLVRTNLVRGENCHLYDDRARRYVDLESGSWAAILGHGHPRVNRVMKEQIDRVIHLGVRSPNHLAEEAAVDLLGLAGMPDGKCTFLSSGSEAVELGVQVARCLTDRPLLLTFSNAYLAAFGSAGRKVPAEWHLLDGNATLAADPEEVLEAVPFERIGGFVLEPGGGAPAFVRFPPAPLVEAIARRIQQQGGVVMVNEVTTGMGRTGRWFGYQHYDLRPDIVAIGKGLGNGYPVSAVLLRREAATRAEAAGLHHAQSHQNNPLGCAVAREVISILREDHLVERGARVGARFRDGLAQLARGSGRVKEARGRGMLLALELDPTRGPAGGEVQAALWERGFIAGGYPAAFPAGTGLRFDPALTIEEADVAALLACLEQLLA